jgi:hypothetical protein
MKRAPQATSPPVTAASGEILQLKVWLMNMGSQAGTAENSVVCDREPPAGRLTTDATVESLAAV